jgi:hypothetical protein
MTAKLLFTLCLVANTLASSVFGYEEAVSEKNTHQSLPTTRMSHCAS